MEIGHGMVWRRNMTWHGHLTTSIFDGVTTTPDLTLLLPSLQMVHHLWAHTLRVCYIQHNVKPSRAMSSSWFEHNFISLPPYATPTPTHTYTYTHLHLHTPTPTYTYTRTHTHTHTHWNTISTNLHTCHTCAGLSHT